tara:strand:+ start:8035 stop:9486 length:1452 start_codon:yes stop_codon:yes gene_type:complete
LIGESVENASRRKWSDYSFVNAPSAGSNFIRQYVERFNTVSYFNEYAGLLSYFYVLGQYLAPYIRIPIHGSHIDCRTHVYWIQESRTGKSVAWDFTAKLLRALDIEAESFTAGSDAKLIGTVEKVPIMGENGKPTGDHDVEVIPGLLNGYKTLLFDEASVLLNDQKAYFSDKILYLQQAMAPLGSETNVLVKHLVGGSVHTPSGVSLWMTTFPPKDIMSHVLEKGFFQRVFLYQNSVDIETRQTTSEHRMSGAYVPVPDKVWSYDDLAKSIKQTGDIIRGRILTAAGMSEEDYSKLSDVEKERLAIKHRYDVFQVSSNFYPALLNAVDDYYALVRQVRNDNIRETAMSFLPNVENYTLIFTNLIAATMGSTKLTSDHVMMATEIIFDNLNNLFIWLEEKESYKQAKNTEGAMKQWKKAWGKCHKMVNNRVNREVVRKSQILEIYSKLTGIAERTARRRIDEMIMSGVVKTVKDGRLVFVYFEV